MSSSLASAKSMRDIEKHLESKGFYLARTKKHRVWKKGAKTIVLPSSGASRGQAFKNYIKMVERES